MDLVNYRNVLHWHHTKNTDSLIGDKMASFRQVGEGNGYECRCLHEDGCVGREIDRCQTTAILTFPHH